MSTVSQRQTVIMVERLSKEYRLGVLGHGSLRRDFQSWWARRRGREDPNSRVIEHGAGHGVRGDRVWALRDVSFSVSEGEVVGIIGRNGSGKSTLLKIISRITAPSSGVVRLRGRVASLLEIGTGFHPELTGRENIFLNGAILGMRQSETRRKFDEIVAFAEIENFVDTPVKRYSSGMYVRLAFSVAAHLEAEILVVDEVLAVGDVQFQRKCLGKMGSVAENGRTVLFVSHNMGAVLQLCSRVISLAEGEVLADTDPVTGVGDYLDSFADATTSSVSYDPIEGKGAQITSVAVQNKMGVGTQSVALGDPVLLSLRYQVWQWPVGSYVCVEASNGSGLRLLWSSDVNRVEDMVLLRSPGAYEALVTIPGTVFPPGRYYFSAAIYAPGSNTVVDHRENAVCVTVVDQGSFLSMLGFKHPAVVALPLHWETRATPESGRAEERGKR